MSKLQDFKRDKVQPEAKKIDSLPLSETSKRTRKRELFRAIVAGQSDLISAEDYQQLREDWANVGKEYTRAKKNGFTGSRETFEKQLFYNRETQEYTNSFEGFNVPVKVKNLVIRSHDYIFREKMKVIKELEKVYDQLAQIKVINENRETGNTVEIAGNTFSFLSPEPNGKDVFAGPKGSRYEDVRYIRGDAIENYLRHNEQIFRKTFLAYLDDNIPGPSRKLAIETFGYLMGFQPRGFRHPNGTFFIGSSGNSGGDSRAWVSRGDGDKVFELNVYCESISSQNPEFAMPVLVRRPSKG